ncbi:hypothetical protein V8G54_012539 [Vigna mungo]|uniref:Carbohydrate kinase PfkB domain-containing protein n=1 Tax=Vigna mungo TaxID=3915 RepID=A0AAQ3S3G4_VIGMU
MRALGTQTNHHDGQSDDSSVNENQRGVGNQPEGQKQWRKQVTLPIFEGIDPLNWIYDAEIFFELRGAAEEEKVRLACMSMEGSAGFWVRAWKEKAKDRSWAGLKAGLINRFGGGFRGTAYEQLATLRQDGMEELALGFFLAGLREEIKGQVRIQDPQDLMIAMRIARDVEDAINQARGGVWNGVKVNPVGTRPTSTIVRGDNDRHFATRTGGAEEVGTIIREGSTVASNTNPRGNTMEGGDSRGRMVRNLPYPEFLKRREEGHRCSEKSLRVLLLAKVEEDEVTEGENPDTNPYTVSLGDGHKRTSRGPCEKIRINLGEATVEEELKLPINDTPPYPVSQGDGHRRMTRGRCEKVDAILGVAWLGKFGELLINWEEMTMVYYLEGKRIRISGHQAVSRQLVESKLTNVESWAIVWKRDQVEKQVEDEWQADLTEEQGAELQVGLQAHYHHRIPLKDAAMLYIGQLYTTARVSSFVLTYYGLCLINGNYTIKFHFAEIIFIHEKSLNNLGKRVFGIYIQGNLVLEDFDIQGEAGGTGRPIAGKGTPGISTRGVYGPLMSANLVGEDEFGYMLADILKENNVNHEGMHFDPGARIALAFVTLRSGGEREFMFYRNPRADMLLQEDELDLDLIRKAKIFHYGSISLITEPCNSAHIATAKVANDAGVVLSYDPNLRLPLWPSEDNAREGILSIWETVDIIKVSEEEISFLTKGEDPYDDVVVRKLFHENLKLLLVTEGAEGYRYYTKEFSGRVKGLKVDVVDITGAGDAFVAGMLSQLAANLSLIQKEEELRDSLKFANVCGALTFGYPGLILEFNLGDKVVEEGGNDRRLRRFPFISFTISYGIRARFSDSLAIVFAVCRRPAAMSFNLSFYLSQERPRPPLCITATRRRSSSFAAVRHRPPAPAPSPAVRRRRPPSPAVRRRRPPSPAVVFGHRLRQSSPATVSGHCLRPSSPLNAPPRAVFLRQISDAYCSRAAVPVSESHRATVGLLTRASSLEYDPPKQPLLPSSLSSASSSSRRTLSHCGIFLSYMRSGVCLHEWDLIPFSRAAPIGPSCHPLLVPPLQSVTAVTICCQSYLYCFRYLIFSERVHYDLPLSRSVIGAPSFPPFVVRGSMNQVRQTPLVNDGSPCSFPLQNPSVSDGIPCSYVAFSHYRTHNFVAFSHYRPRQSVMAIPVVLMQASSLLDGAILSKSPHLKFHGAI